MTCWAKPVRPIAPAIFSSEVDAEHKLENLYDGRAQYDDHHHRQDQQNQRQEHLDGSLLRGLLGAQAP